MNEGKVHGLFVIQIDYGLFYVVGKYIFPQHKRTESVGVDDPVHPEMGMIMLMDGQGRPSLKIE